MIAKRLRGIYPEPTPYIKKFFKKKFLYRKKRPGLLLPRPPLCRNLLSSYNNMTERHHAYCFTINNYTDYDLGDVLQTSEEAVYLIIGFEVGKKGTPHLQGYVNFRSARTFSSIRKKLPRARLSVAKGTPKQNYDYCSKDGDFWESGKLPQSGVAQREYIEHIMQNTYENFQVYN